MSSVFSRKITMSTFSGCFTGLGTPSNQRTGRRQTYRSRIWRSATLSDRMPPPTGVVSGPLIPIRYSLKVATVSSGSQLPVSRYAFSPASTSLHAMVLPCFFAEASRTAFAAGQISTPVPSPSMKGMMGSSGTLSVPSPDMVIFSAIRPSLSAGLTMDLPGPTEIGVDLPRRPGEVERVEVDARCSAIQQLLAQHRRHLDADPANLIGAVGTVVQPLRQSSRERRPGELGEPLDLAHVRHRYDTGNDGLVDAERVQFVEHREIVLRLEEELRDGKVRQVQLCGQVSAITLSILRAGMQLRMGRDADREVADPPHQFDELRGVREIGININAVGGQVTCERQQVLEALFPIAGHDVADLRSALTDTGQMRHRHHRGLGVDVPYDLPGLVTGGPSRPIGDRHKRG